MSNKFDDLGNAENFSTWCFNLEYKEILIDNNPTVKKQMINLSNRNTVPQIFFGDKHIGGYDDLQKLNKEGVIFNLINEKK